MLLPCKSYASKSNFCAQYFRSWQQKIFHVRNSLRGLNSKTTMHHTDIKNSTWPALTLMLTLHLDDLNSSSLALNIRRCAELLKIVSSPLMIAVGKLYSYE